MGILDRLRRDPAVEQYRNDLEVAAESVRDLSLKLEDRGWARIGTDDDAFSIDALKAAAKDGRALAVAHPLVRRGLSLRTAYVHGQGGPQVTVDYDGDQDVAGVVQAWWGSRENQGALTGPEARARLERSLSTDGNVFIASFTNPRAGTVVNRTIPFDEITEIITNPQDRLEVWFYRRRYTARELADSAFGVRTVDRDVEVLYPDLAFAPTLKPRTVDGVEVRWNEPIRHVKVNDLDGWLFGIGDTYSIGPYARMYRDFLGDWAKLTRSLSQFAWRLTADGRRQKTAQRALAGAAAAGAGASVVQGIGESIEAIPKTGATIDADSGRPILAMIAAGLDVPVTMLSTDPGVTGARATAETLNEPMLLSMGARRDVWTAVYQDIAEYVIEKAITAPQGALTGDLVADPWTRTDRAVIDGVDPRIQVAWPDLRTESTEVMVKAIAEADSRGKLPPLVIARLFLVALGVDDIDEILKELTDDEGNWIDPNGVGPAIVRSFQTGEDPAVALGQYARFGGSTAAAEAMLRGES